MTKRLTFISLVVLLLTANAEGGGQWVRSKMPPPDQYGNVLINRLSEKNGQKAVSFSHWLHRQEFSCRVCHLELEFEMRTNTTEITEEANREGEFCGTCHDDETAFGHTEDNCEKCHNGDISYSWNEFDSAAALPEASFGDKINWVEAVSEGWINPKQSLFGDEIKDMGFTKVLDLAAEWNNIPPSVFPHDIHVRWLDCANCHPDIFNVKKKTTKHFRMDKIIEGKFCGLCHMNVAFPIEDCMRCHPTLKGNWG